MQGSPRHAWGIAASLLASTLFAVVFYLAGSVQASGTSVFAWRVLATPIIFLPFATRAHHRASVRDLWTAVTRRWWLPLVFIFVASAMGFTAWLFMWAPRNGHGLDASLGFLLLPIALVLASRVVLRSHVSKMQWFVVGLAAIAVAVKALATPELGWVTIAAAGGLTVYFIVRTYFKLASLTAFAFESALIVPVAAVILFRDDTWYAEAWLLLLIGLLAGIAMTSYVGASAILPMPVFGLLSYVEPLLLVVASFLLGERMAAADGFVYGILAVALILLAISGFVEARKIPRYRPKEAT